MSFSDLISSTLTFAKAQSSGTLSHGSNEYAVCKAYSPGDARVMMDAGYDPESVDMVVLLAAADIVGDGPAAHDAVDLDGTDYIVTSTVTKNAVYWQIPLRKAV